MLNPKMQENSLELQMPLSESGRPPEKSTTLESQMGEIDSMISKVSLTKEVKKKPLKKKKTKEKVISTAESPATPKKKILKDKSTTSKKNTQNTKLSKISPVVSISNAKDSTKYWTTQCKDLSKKLWLPTETGCVGLHGNTSTGCSNTLELISSSKINKNIAQNLSLAKTCSPLSTYSPHDTTVSGGSILLKKLQQTKLKTLKKQESQLHQRLIKQNPDRIKKEILETDVDKYIISSKRIKVRPMDGISRRTINDGMAVHRKIWNCCVNEIQINPTITEIELRDKFVTKINMSEKNLKELDWTFRIAQKVREAVTRKFFANYKTAQENFKAYKRKYFYKIKKKKKKKCKKKITMRFKEKMNDKQTIYLNKEICKFKICPTSGKTILETFNGVVLVLQENYTNFSTSTTCERCKKAFSTADHLSAHTKIKKPCEISLTNIISGIPHAELILQRIGYDYYLYVPEYKDEIYKPEAPDTIVAIDAGWNTLLTYYSPNGEWGEICPGIKDKILELQKKITAIKVQKYKKLKSNTLKKAIQKRKLYILNMIDDLHWKICHWLLSKFRKIIISRLYVARTNKQGKQIQADLQLCTFVDRLIHKSIEYKGSEVHVGKEHYTSKACTNCLSLNTVKDSTVRCKDCKHSIHRDLNGARNIFLKHCY